MARNDDEYHRLEGKKEGKLKLKKTWGWTLLFVYSLASFIILYGMTPPGVDMPRQMFLSDFSTGDAFFSYSIYYPIAIAISVIVWGIVIPDSYEVATAKIYALSKKKKRELTDFERYKIKGLFYFDRVIFYSLYFVSSMFFSGLKDEAEKEKFFFRYGWIDHIDRNFFRQCVRKEDGYERADSLKLFADYKQMLACKRKDEAEASREMSFMYWLFKGKKGLEDLLLIAEGGLRMGKMKYDRILSRKEYVGRMKQFGGDKERGLDSFQLFNGSDEVLFSSDIIKELIRQESGKFENYIRSYAINSRTLFSRRFTNYASAFLKDKNMKKYLFASKEQAEKFINDPEKLSEHIVFVLVMYFRIVLLKIIIGQYINLPAGTMVVKMRDYSIRMIIETFDDNCLIETIHGKNDGSTTTFNSDNLVNIFLAAFNHYKKSMENSLDDRIYRIFNFRDEKIEENNIEAEVSKMSSVMNDVGESIADPSSEWLERLRQDLAS